MKKAAKFIEKELIDLDVNKESMAWKHTFINAIEAADSLTKDQLKRYIESQISYLPTSYFY